MSEGKEYDSAEILVSDVLRIVEAREGKKGKVLKLFVSPKFYGEMMHCYSFRSVDPRIEKLNDSDVRLFAEANAKLHDAYELTAYGSPRIATVPELFANTVKGYGILAEFTTGTADEREELPGEHEGDAAPGERMISGRIKVFFQNFWTVLRDKLLG